MVRKAIQVVAPKFASIKMETSRILGHFPDTDLKLREEVLRELARFFMVSP